MPNLFILNLLELLFSRLEEPETSLLTIQGRARKAWSAASSIMCIGPWQLTGKGYWQNLFLQMQLPHLPCPVVLDAE